MRNRMVERERRVLGLLRVVSLLVGVLAGFGASSAAGAQERVGEGRIAGQILDAGTGRPIQSAEVRVEGLPMAVLTDVNGRYRTAALPAGSYTVVIERLGYAQARQVGVVVEEGRTTTLSVPLTSSALQIEGLVVESERSGDVSSNAGLLRMRQAAPSVSDGISAEQIGRAPDSDAGDAIARVTGVSVVDSKFVVVRGLAERYSNTLLNGAELSSPEPAKRVVPLDIFPASLLESLLTTKTATPDKPGDFAGGSVEIQTKEFPDERVLQFKMSQGWNSVSTFKNVPYFPRRGRDYLAFDGRRREFEGVPLTTEPFMEALRNEWRPSPRRSLPNTGFGVDFGDQIGAFDNALGYVLSFDYGTSTVYEPSDVFAFVASDNGRKATESVTSSSTVTTDWGVVANASKRFGPSHKISFKNLLTRDAEEYVGSGFEFDPDARSGFSSELTFDQVRYLTRTFWQAQVAGLHQVGFPFSSTIDWKATFSWAKRNEPENRTITYVLEESTGLRMPDASKPNDFWFRFLDDKTYVGQVDWSIPLALRREGDTQIKVGGLIRQKRRDFNASLFNVRPPLSGPPDGVVSVALPPEELLAPENLGRNVLTVNISPAGLPYDASDDLKAGYAMVDLSLFRNLRLVGGVRAEQWDLSVTPGGGGDTAGALTQRSVLDILPSGNLTYNLIEGMNFRLAYYRTVNRPDPRELSTSPYAAVSGECNTFGNPELQPAKIENGDARIEWFPSPGDVLSIGGFYKRFDAPIVQVVRLESLACVIFPANTHSATNLGVELEVRMGLGSLGKAFEPVSLGSNFTFVDGDVVPGSDLFGDLANLPLQDQSPFLANANLDYDSEGGAFSASVLVNYFADRVRRYGIFQTVTTSGGGSTQIRSPDVYERTRTTIDGKVRVRFGEHLNVSLSGNNLTNQKPIEFQKSEIGDVVVGSSSSGTSVSISVSYSY